MLFNKDRIAAQAGKPVEIVFENSDIMPHNFVVTRPGALEEIGLLGESSSHAARGPRAELRAPLRQDPRRQPAARPARLAEAQLHRPLQAGRVSLCLHLSRPLAADVWRVLRRRGHRRYTLPIRRATWPLTRCRSSTTCSRITARARSGPTTTSPRRSKASVAAGRSPTASRSSRSRAASRATG